MNKRLVYVAGPLTSGNTIQNVRTAVEAGTEILKAGHAAYVPHLSVLWDWVTPMDYEDWMGLDFEIIRRCDALLRLPGECPGCEREVAFARGHEIPIFFSLSKCIAWLNASYSAPTEPGYWWCTTNDEHGSQIYLVEEDMSITDGALYYHISEFQGALWEKVKGPM